MFNTLKPNSPFYVFDKNDHTLYIGKVANVTSVDYSNPLSYTMGITVNTEAGTYNFKQVPANLTIATDDGTNTVISDNIEDLAKEVEKIRSYHQSVVDGFEFSKTSVEKCDAALVLLNPKIAKEKENEKRLNILDSRIGNVESGISDIKNLLNRVLDKNIGDNNYVDGRNS